MSHEPWDDRTPTPWDQRSEREFRVWVTEYLTRLRHDYDRTLLVQARFEQRLAAIEMERDV